MRTRTLLRSLVPIVFLTLAACQKSDCETCPPAAPVARESAPVPAEFPTKYAVRSGQTIDLADYRGKNVVLVVVRGMPESPGGVFCPMCLAQTQSLVRRQADFATRNAELFVLFPGEGDRAGAFADQTRGEAEKLPFDLLLDKDLAAIDRLNIRGDRVKPSTYILDRNGAVVFAYVGQTTTDRPKIDDLLTRLDKLNASR